MSSPQQTKIKSWVGWTERDEHVILLAQQVSQRHRQSESSRFNMLLWWAGGGGGDSPETTTPHTHTYSPRETISTHLSYVLWHVVSSKFYTALLHSNGFMHASFWYTEVISCAHSCLPLSQRHTFLQDVKKSKRQMHVYSHTYLTHTWLCAPS